MGQAYRQQADATAFLSRIAQQSSIVDVSGKLFDARSTSAYNDHTINAGSLGQTGELYNKLPGKLRGITPGVRGAYAAHVDAATDGHMVGKSQQEVRDLLKQDGSQAAGRKRHRRPHSSLDYLTPLRVQTAVLVPSTTHHLPSMLV